MENFVQWNLERIVLYPGWEQLTPGTMSWLLLQHDLIARRVPAVRDRRALIPPPEGTDRACGGAAVVAITSAAITTTGSNDDDDDGGERMRTGPGRREQPADLTRADPAPGHHDEPGADGERADDVWQVFYVAHTMDFHARRVEVLGAIQAYEDDELFTSSFYTSTSCSSRKNQ
uniref:Uncharacterized protein n=1 Tax=Anopheles dirus TaxID=7168 RepID=A0A182NLN4_9DIPT